MHVDEIAARRTQAGRIVAMGLHASVDVGVAVRVRQHRLAAGRVRVKFLKWVYLGHEIVLTLPPGESVNPRTINVSVLGMIALTIELTYGQAELAHGETALTPSPVCAAWQRCRTNVCRDGRLHGRFVYATSIRCSRFFPRTGRFFIFNRRGRGRRVFSSRRDGGAWTPLDRLKT
jgi:hypothetical protein